MLLKPSWVSQKLEVWFIGPLKKLNQTYVWNHNCSVFSWYYSSKEWPPESSRVLRRKTNCRHRSELHTSIISMLQRESRVFGLLSTNHTTIVEYGGSAMKYMMNTTSSPVHRFSAQSASNSPSRSVSCTVVLVYNVRPRRVRCRPRNVRVPCVKRTV